MKILKTFLLSFAMAAGLLLSIPVQAAESGNAYGSLVFSDDGGGDWSWGMAWNDDSASDALAVAMRGCRNEGGENCREINTFRNACVALATGEGGGYGAGGESKDEAGSESFWQCRAAGDENCRIEVIECAQAGEVAGRGETLSAELFMSPDIDLTSPPPSFRDCDVCPEMQGVPGGSFMMGSQPWEELRDDDEGPVHRVTITAPFAVGVYEVTFAEWNACVADGGCNGYSPGDGLGRDKKPIIDVSWEDAQSYLQWLSGKAGKPYRLLSESEWEYAARARTTKAYYFGGSIASSQAKYGGSIFDIVKTVPVGSYPANGFGLHDMHGNVWEWVQDCWNESCHGAPSEGSAWESGDCRRRVLRGGSWLNYSALLRSANRSWGSSRNRIIGNNIGFRVARAHSMDLYLPRSLRGPGE